MRSRIALTVMVALCCAAIAPADVRSWSHPVDNVTRTPGGVESGVRINSSGQMMWLGDGTGGSDVFLWNGSGPAVNVSNDAADRVWAHELNDAGNAVWSPWGSPYGMHFVEDAGSASVEITDAWLDTPAMNDQGHVAWAEGDFIYLWDGTNATEIWNSPALFGPEDVAINDADQIAWIERGDHFDPDINGYEIFFWDGYNVTNISDDAFGWDTAPAINNSGHVAWTGDSSYDVWLWNGTTKTKIKEHASDNCDYVQISDSGEVVWYRFNPGNEIEYWDGSAVIILTADLDEGRRPRINDRGQAVWYGKDSAYGDDYEIFYYDGRDTYVVTDNDVDDMLPEIDGDWIAWQSEGDIHRTNSSPEPGTIALLGIGLAGLVGKFRRREK